MRPFSLILFAALQIMLKYLNILIIDLNQFKQNPSYNQLVIDLLELKGGFVKQSGEVNFEETFFLGK